MEAKMAELLMADEAEEARETPEPTTAATKVGGEGVNAVDTEGVAGKTVEGDKSPSSNSNNGSKLTPPTPPAVKINGGVSAASTRGTAATAEKSPVDAISTWSEEGCHVFMPNWGETSSTNVSLLGRTSSPLCKIFPDIAL